MLSSIKQSVAVFFWLAAGAANAASMPADYSEESPKVRELLTQADVLAGELDDPDKGWSVAKLYCTASRLGSAEAQYRLGMQYAFGKGVPENREQAAALFQVAAHQGHFQAQNMLETINLQQADKLPQCVLAEVLPEKLPPRSSIRSELEPEITRIERYVETLPKSRRWVVEMVRSLSDWYGIDPNFALSVIAVESNFSPEALSNKDAMGLMQLIPATAERFNVKNAFDATQNIKGGLKYLRWLLSYFKGDVQLVAAAYNAGERAVDRYKGVPPYPETRNYVKRVMEFYQRASHPYEENLVMPSPVVLKKG
ncbi:lytic transglycosylase [Methylobacillus sp. MM3]|nr:lytic transglycosylase [Methylobacillus sp. MM3]